MVIYSCYDPIMRLTFSSSLKGVASDWFYSRPPRSLHNFMAVIETFLIQYTSRQEAKRNSHHLLSVNTRQGEVIHQFLIELTNQVSNCGKEVSTLAFISELQVTHALYKYLLKHNVAKMSEVLFRAQPYIQLEEVMKVSFIHSAKRGDSGGKSKSPHEAPDYAQDRH